MFLKYFENFTTYCKYFKVKLKYFVVHLSSQGAESVYVVVRQFYTIRITVRSMVPGSGSRYISRNFLKHSLFNIAISIDSQE